jgi:small subunit ribosomal protein S4e
MHLTRQEATTRLPIARKGTKYIARAASNPEISIPVVIAVRDMLGLAKTAKEVKQMIHQKLLKIDGKDISDIHESICLFDVFHADKDYVLTLSPKKKFQLEEAKAKSERIAKVAGRNLVSGGKIQIHLHDGTSIIGDSKIKVGDTLHIDFENKVKKHISLEKGRDAFIISGKYAGLHGKIENVHEKKVLVKFKDGSAVLNEAQAVAL